MYSKLKKAKNVIFFTIFLLPTITFAKAESSETCLAKTIYYECRGCSNQSEKEDIAKLVINRTKQGTKFPNTICGVIRQKGQFKWTAHQFPIKDKKSWEQSKAIAKTVLSNPRVSKLKENVVFFKQKTSRSRLAKNIKKVSFKDKRSHNFYELNNR